MSLSEAPPTLKSNFESKEKNMKARVNDTESKIVTRTIQLPFYSLEYYFYINLGVIIASLFERVCFNHCTPYPGTSITITNLP